MSDAEVMSDVEIVRNQRRAAKKKLGRNVNLKKPLGYSKKQIQNT